MYPLLASAGRILLILALVLTGPGLSARTMAGMQGHGGHGAAVAADAVEAPQRVVPGSACHDMPTPLDAAAGPGSSGTDAALAGDQDGAIALDGAPSTEGCCGHDMGCECECAQLSAPAATVRAIVVPARFSDAPASAADTWRIASPRARLNRPPIA